MNYFDQLKHAADLAEWPGWDCLASAQSACSAGVRPRAPDNAGEPAPWLVHAAAKRRVHGLELVPVPDLWCNLRCYCGPAGIAAADCSGASVSAT